jgi:hypothetical protein
LTSGGRQIREWVDGDELLPRLLGPFEHGVEDVLALVCRPLFAARDRDVEQHRRRIVIGDRGNGAIIPAVGAADAIERRARGVAGAMRDQLGIMVERDDVGVGLAFFSASAYLGASGVPPEATVLRASLAISRAFISGISG